MSSYWARIVDDMTSLGEHKGRFMNVDQLVDVVQGAYDRAMSHGKCADGLDRLPAPVHLRCRLRWLLQSQTAMQNWAVPVGEHWDYVTFCELMAPSVLSRCALQLFCSLKRSSSKGADIAELQHALMLGRIRSGDIAIMTMSQPPKHLSTAEYLANVEYVSKAHGSSREFVSFHDFHEGLCSLAPADFSAAEVAASSRLSCTDVEQLLRIGPGKAETRRAKLQRDLRACCDAIAASASSAAADVGEANLDSPERPRPQRPSTGRIGSRKLLEPLRPSRPLNSLPDGRISSDLDEDIEEAGSSPV
jgi:hypothetical protein